MRNSIVCGDSASLMGELDEASIDLIVTSPPYNAKIDYDVYDDDRPVEEYHDWLRQACRQMFRVIKSNSNIFINICDIGVSNGDAKGKHKIGPRGNFYVVPHHTVVIDEMIRCGAQYLHPIFWAKPSNHTSQFGASARFCGTYPYPKNCHVPSEIEYVLHFRKNGKYEKVDTKIKEASKLSKDRWFEISSQIWRFNGERDKGHPATFPIELPSRCIEAWSFVGDLVLDPFCGTGKTASAAKSLGRDYLGFDLSEDYCQMARSRLSDICAKAA